MLKPADSSTQPALDGIAFNCDHCAAQLVAEPGAAGSSLPCKKCGELTHVPLSRGGRPDRTVAPSAEKLSALQGHLRENDAQRTEITGHINQLNIQLHRHKLRLQKLNERRAELLEEINRNSEP